MLARFEFGFVLCPDEKLDFVTSKGPVACEVRSADDGSG